MNKSLVQEAALIDEPLDETATLINPAAVLPIKSLRVTLFFAIVFSLSFLIKAPLKTTFQDAVD